MKDYPPLPDGLPRVLSASSALTACPDSVCPVLDAPELEQLTGSSDRWIAGRLRRLPLRNEDNEPRRIRDLSAGYAEQGHGSHHIVPYVQSHRQQSNSC